MAKSIKPLPISGTSVKITGGPYKGKDGKVNGYNQGRLFVNIKRNKEWVIIGPISLAHIEEVI